MKSKGLMGMFLIEYLLETPGGATGDVTLTCEHIPY